MADQGSVREATQHDIDKVVELWAELVSFHARYDPRYMMKAGADNGFADHLRSHLDDANHLLLVAEMDGEVVGFLNGELLEYPPCFEHRSHGFIDNMAVSPQWQRIGLGTALLEKGMAWFSAKGVPTVEGKVHLLNPLAMGFWQKTGFEPYMQTIRAPTKASE